jgi:hypothetical protein
MISPDEIKKIALKWWEPLLRSAMTGDPFFPTTIDRIGKVQSVHITQRFDELQKEIETLYRHSKNQTGIGYRVQTAEYNFRRTGNHELPDNIVFETIDDYLSVTGRKKEWRTFLQNHELIIAAISQLNSWALQHALWLTNEKINWNDILKVCLYFIDTPKPDLYIRQLPIAIHTKFIEENATLIQSLLDFLIPDHIRNSSQKRFAERYFLRYDEPLIRLRLLDNPLNCLGGFSDLSIPLSDFEKLDIPVKNVLVTENKMNFLTLPPIASTIAVWSGGGFNVSYLKKTDWLSEKNIFYWGDIDEHGFQILHQLRSYHPQTQSVLMDNKTFEEFAVFTVAGERNKADLILLTDDENQLYQKLKLAERNRLEQEKIPQVYVDEYLNRVLE